MIDIVTMMIRYGQLFTELEEDLSREMQNQEIAALQGADFIPVISTFLLGGIRSVTSKYCHALHYKYGNTENAITSSLLRKDYIYQQLKILLARSILFIIYHSKDRVDKQIKALYFPGNTLQLSDEEVGNLSYLHFILYIICIFGVPFK
jgi:hypothetical protein